MAEPEPRADVIQMPAQAHQLELADARIVQCAWCDGRSFTNPCHVCVARLAESGTQNRSAS